MTRREEYEAKAEQMLTPLMEEHGFELVDVEYVKEAGNWYLRAYVGEEGGITLDDCELVNRAWSDMMDADDFIEDAYILEVSSQGWEDSSRRKRTSREALEKILTYIFTKGRRIPGGKNGKEVTVKESDGNAFSVYDGYDNDTDGFRTGICGEPVRSFQSKLND